VESSEHSLPHAAPPKGSRWRRIGPIVALLLLAPVISELLYGAVRISILFILIPEILTWGCGALLIRECARRWGGGWQNKLLMGLALAVAEEWVMQQTSISPLARMGEQGYGRVWGVNWVYLLWALGYESVWVVLVPVQLAELLFPEERSQCWLRVRGLVIASTVFALGAFLAWYGWTQRARVKIFHMAPYSPPPAYILIGVATILVLMAAAYALPSPQLAENSVATRSAPAPWIVAVVSCALGTPWAAAGQLGWGVGHLPTVPFEVVLMVGLVWAGLTFFVMRRWTSSPNWGDAQRFALVFGGVLACMFGGFVVFTVGGALRIDWIGKIVMNAGAFAWLISIGRAVQRRKLA
jgi:hypothetical protein